MSKPAATLRPFSSPTIVAVALLLRRPPSYSDFLPFMDEMCANNAEKAKTFVDNLEAVWNTRPLTLCHGDMNPGNIWRQKDKGQEEFVIGDWQLVAKWPVAWDFVLLFLCTQGLDIKVRCGLRFPAAYMYSYRRKSVG